MGALLWGPPELHTSRPPPPQAVAPAPTASTTTTTEAFMDLMNTKFNTTRVPSVPRIGRTENKSGTYETSGNECLNFFFHTVPTTPKHSLILSLQSAWTHQPETALKLIFNLRGVRGTGKNDKEGFFSAVRWLHDHHPKSLACNIASFADFGCLKDLPELLYRMLEGDDIRVTRKMAWEKIKGSAKLRKLEGVRHSWTPFQRRKSSGKRKSKPAASRDIRVKNTESRHKIEKQKASERRNQRRYDMARKVIDRYGRDSNFRYLYDRISDFFAASLKSDVECLKNGDVCKIGLAAKWCPSVGSAYDKATLLCESIARKMFKREDYPEYQALELAHYVYRVRDRLRKEVLVPLRKVLELPEVYIGAKEWGLIPYNRVPSAAMKFYKEKFLKRDADRFLKYLKDVRSGKAKIAGDALLPHEIIHSLEDGDGGLVGELQWKRRKYVSSSQKGKLKNCLAVCDVSSSMKGKPMEVSLALGILVSDMSKAPWKGKIITFEENPKLESVEGRGLREKIEFARNIKWDYKSDVSDLQKVFDLILKVAVDGKLKNDKMVKRLFVFSDMEFDKASPNEWETDYQVIRRKFTEQGYGDVVPEIVFWNLRSSKSIPVYWFQKGVALVSGYSKNLLKLFVDMDDELTPESVMRKAIEGEEYQKLVVIDS